MYHYRSFAKLNLYLDIFPKAGRLHPLSMVMQSVSLYDELWFEPISNKHLEIVSNVEEITQENIMQKAYSYFLASYMNKVTHGWVVKLKKSIPLGGGLAGGSGNAAVMVHLMQRAFNISLTREELTKLNLKLGSDVNFSYFGGTSLVESLGDSLNPCRTPWRYYILVVPKVTMNTAEAFRLWDILEASSHNPIALSINEVSRGFVPYNAFEKVVFSLYPELLTIKQQLLCEGALHGLLTGSGSTVFGIFNSKEAQEQAYKRLKLVYDSIYKVSNRNTGFSVLS